jgi:hypothetical protein
MAFSQSPECFVEQANKRAVSVESDALFIRCSSFRWATDSSSCDCEMLACVIGGREDRLVQHSCAVVYASDIALCIRDGSRLSRIALLFTKDEIKQEGAKSEDERMPSPPFLTGNDACDH